MADDSSKTAICIQDFPKRPEDGQRQLCTNGYTYRYEAKTTSWTVCGMVGIQGPQGPKGPSGDGCPPPYINEETKTWWVYEATPNSEFVVKDTGMPCTGLSTLLNFKGTIRSWDNRPNPELVKLTDGDAYYVLNDFTIPDPGHEDGEPYVIFGKWSPARCWQPDCDSGRQGKTQPLRAHQEQDGADGKDGEGYAMPVLTLPKPGLKEYKRGRLYLTINNVLAVAVGGENVPTIEDGKYAYNDWQRDDRSDYAD